MKAKRERRGSVRRGAIVLWMAIVLSTTPAQSAVSFCPAADIGQVVPAEDGIRVLEPVSSELRPGDVLVQLNGHRLRTCDDVAAAIREARTGQLAVLVLLRRDQQSATVTIELREETAQSAAGAGPVAPTALAAPALSQSGVEAVRDTAGDALRLGRELRQRLPVTRSQPWVRRVEELRQTYEQRRAEVAAVGVLEAIMGYYETVAEILVYRENARGTDRLPQRPDAPFDFNSGSQVSGWLERYPFLQASVIQPPEKVSLIVDAERSGLWSPDRAIEILIDRAVAEGEEFAAGLTR